MIEESLPTVEKYTIFCKVVEAVLEKSMDIGRVI